MVSGPRMVCFRPRCCFVTASRINEALRMNCVRSWQSLATCFMSGLELKMVSGLQNNLFSVSTLFGDCFQKQRGRQAVLFSVSTLVGDCFMNKLGVKMVSGLRNTVFGPWWLFKDWVKAWKWTLDPQRCSVFRQNVWLRRENGLWPPECVPVSVKMLQDWLRRKDGLWLPPPPPQRSVLVLDALLVAASRVSESWRWSLAPPEYFPWSSIEQNSAGRHIIWTVEIFLLDSKSFTENTRFKLQLWYQIWKAIIFMQFSKKLPSIPALFSSLPVMLHPPIEGVFFFPRCLCDVTARITIVELVHG